MDFDGICRNIKKQWYWCTKSNIDIMISYIYRISWNQWPWIRAHGPTTAAEADWVSEPEPTRRARLIITQQATRVTRADFQSNSVPNLVVASCHLKSFDVNFLDPSEFYTHPPFAALEALDVSDICCLFTSSLLSRLCLRFSTKAAAKKAAANMFRSVQILFVLPWVSILHIAYRYDILIWY